MRSSRWMLMLLLLAVVPLGGCGDGNSACEPCDNLDDCEDGLTCQTFENDNGDIRTLCGDANPTMTCPGN